MIRRIALFAQYDALKEVRARARKDLLAESHRHPMSKVLESGRALHNVRIILEDPAAAVHNPAYARTLLDEAALAATTR